MGLEARGKRGSEGSGWKVTQRSIRSRPGHATTLSSSPFCQTFRSDWNSALSSALNRRGESRTQDGRILNQHQKRQSILFTLRPAMLEGPRCPERKPSICANPVVCIGTRTSRVTILPVLERRPIPTSTGGLESTSGAAGRNRLAEACGFSVWTYNSPSYEAYEPFQAGTDRRKPLETPLETARDPSSHENLSYRIRLPKHGPIPKSKQHGQEPYTREWRVTFGFEKR